MTFVHALGDVSLSPLINPSVEAWRADIARSAGDLPVNFLLMWIQKESNGNPCSWTSLQEAGIFQLMAGDNIAQGNTSLDQQHPVPPCSPGVQTTAYRSSLSDEQARWQVDGGLTYVRYCRKRADDLLSAAGYKWSSKDWSYWAMVKMVHVAPGTIPGMLQQGIAGYGSPPPDWDTLMTYVTGIPPSWTDNAKAVGIMGQGGGGMNISGQILVFAALGAGVMALLALTKHQRSAH